MPDRNDRELLRRYHEHGAVLRNLVLVFLLADRLERVELVVALAAP